jgi:leucyl-tRNA synthetase
MKMNTNEISEYRPLEIEKKWQDIWYSSAIYAAEDFSKRPKKYILTEFPYPSGDGLHVGHGRTYTMADAVARHARMKGHNVLFPMGWDAFGLPAENSAIKEKIHPTKIVKRNTDTFRTQMKRLGLSFDWSREINTTDPSYYRWTQWIFLQLFKHGLAYKQEMPINWCPKCKVGLANEEVVNGRHERCNSEVGEKKLSQWMLKITAYADRLADELDDVDYTESIKTAQRSWVGRKEWIDITYPLDGADEEIVVSTTRPDTNYGSTFVVLAPEHPILDPVKGLVPEERRKEVDAYIENAKKKSDLERLSECREKTGVFTGMYCINRIDDRKLPIYVTDFVLMDVGTGAVVGVPGHDMRDFEFAQKFDIPVIRVVVGTDGDTSPITRKEHVQEEEGTMINSGFLDGLDIHEATQKMMDYMEEKGWGKRTVRYHLRDWIFSRQHYWGEPIPIVHCDKCGMVPVPEEALPLELPDVESYEPTDTGESPLAAITEWVETDCPKCGGPAKRETDTMPNWAGSSWYFLRYCDPDCDTAIADKKKLEYWMPVDHYDGGAEHTTLHLLYSRFWHKFLNDIGAAPGKEPYAKRRNHGMVLGEGGVLMSKSKGNSIAPDEMVDRYGADVTRLYLLFMGPYAGTVEWNTRAVEGVKRFVARLWDYFMDRVENPAESCDRSVEKELNATIHKIDSDIPALKYNTAVAAMMEFYNLVNKKPMCRDCLEKLAVMVAPFMPHIAEEFWAALGHTDSVHAQLWPEVDESSLAEETIEIPVQINGKVRGRVEIPADASEDTVKEAVMALEAVKTHLKGKDLQDIKTFLYVPRRIVTIVV